MTYDFKNIEKKWQEVWEASGVFKAKEDKKLPKFYPLVEFPYPSGAGLHVGHPRSYVALDVVARKRRMQGYNVLYCMGWDAFGLPTENYAIKNKIHPKEVNQKNIEHFKAQIKALGISFDWSREIDTTDPKYYRFTQWIFLQMFKKGLAYKAEVAVNWCTDCKVVLANEEVVAGRCERCNSEVVKKNKSQWMLKITKYAQRLLDDLDEVDYPQKVKSSQKNWIGRSEGAQIKFEVTAAEPLEVYTTRPETIYGVTYIAISPEHKSLPEMLKLCANQNEVEKYIEEAGRKSDLERTDLAPEKTGVKLEGVFGVNPATKEEIPVFVADYVLANYGTGVIMAVPAHDKRDEEFAKKHGLPIIEVLKNNATSPSILKNEEEILINSGLFNGLKSSEARARIENWIESTGIGERKINFKLRDWVFSRQRYWGEPIPIINCKKCGEVALGEEQLPLELPQIESYEQTQTGESPLAKIDWWVNVTCPNCKGAAKRETDTMPQWAGSSWYFLRYCDPHNEVAFASKEALEYWMPVDWYNGGMEHTTLHLLYSRFWYKFLFDIGVVPTKEPYAKRTSHGMILGENNEKMSKSRGNVVNPDEIVDQYGADTLRLYEMFIGDFESAASWDAGSIKGCKRFLDRVFGLLELARHGPERFSSELEISFHKTIKKVSQDIECLKFNTAIAALMSLVSRIYENKSLNHFELRVFLKLLCVFAPHITEEVWSVSGFEGLACTQCFPDFDEALCVDATTEIAVQVNGKIKLRMMVSAETPADEVIILAQTKLELKELLEIKKIKKSVYVAGRLVNFVV